MTGTHAGRGAPLPASLSVPGELMGARLVALLTAAMLAWLWAPAEAQTLGQVFKRVSPSVVVIRTKEKDVAARVRGQAASVSGVGSGVLIS